MNKMLREIWQRSGLVEGKGSQSSALKPLSWIIGALLASIVLITIFKGSLLVVYLLFGLLVAFSIYFGFEHCYLIRHNTDALRSDKVVISKYAIERGWVGDNKTGIIELDDKGTKPPAENNRSVEKS